MKLKKSLPIVACVGLFVLLTSDVVEAGSKKDVRVVVTNTPLPVQGLIDSGYTLIGVSEDLLAGNSRLGRMHGVCQATFGPTARMCTLREAVISPLLAKLAPKDLHGSVAAWVHPAEVDYDTHYQQPDMRWYESTVRSTVISSVWHFAIMGYPTIDCNGWTVAPGEDDTEYWKHRGAAYVLTVYGDADFKCVGCAIKAPVMCCGPPE